MAEEDRSLREYYDILVIGHTGMGKSTTVDKMLTANPVGSVTCDTASQQQEPVYNRSSQQLECADVTMWLVSDLESATLRLKNLVFSQSLENPHLEINQLHDRGMNIYRETSECELLSNQVSRVRVLDVPGFFSGEGDDSGYESSFNTLLRKVLCIMHTFNLKFRRVMYFLPVRGPLERLSEVLNQELLTMAHYFGKAVFESMVIIATAPTRMSLNPSIQDSLFVEEDEEVTRQQFHIALKKNVLPLRSKGSLPDPPIIFISMLDECEEILEKVKSAKVAKSFLELSLDSGICIKCSCSIKETEGERVLCNPKGSNETTFIPYEESLCHPLFIPKHSELADIVTENGVKNLVLKKTRGKAHSPSGEVCHKCKKSPREEGCMLVGTKYEITVKSKKKEIFVDHTNRVEKHRMLSQRESDDEEDDIFSDDDYIRSQNQPHLDDNPLEVVFPNRPTNLASQVQQESEAGTPKTDNMA